MRRGFFRLSNAVVIAACLMLAMGAGRASAATAVPAATTTSLTLGQPAVAFGQEAIEQFAVTVATAGTGAPAGTVTISAGSSAVCTVTLAPVSATTAGGSCSPAAAGFVPGSYQLTAAYAGDGSHASSASAPSALAVSKGATATSLSLSAATVGYAAQQAEEITVSVQSPDGAVPAGSVQVSAGAVPVCSIALSAGAGSCALTAAEFAPGSYQLTASYAGSPDYAASVSESEALTVTRTGTTTTLKLSAATVGYGDEETVQATVAVSGAGPVAPAGTVTVSSGVLTLCKIALSATGGASCRLPSAVDFAPGTYHLTAEYSATAGDEASASAPQTLAVTAAATTTSLAFSAPATTYGSEQSERLSVVVSPAYGGTPSGVVTVADGTATVCSIALAAATASAQGSCLLSATAIAPGTGKLIASYAGNGDFAASKSASAFLAISPAATKTVLSLSAPAVSYGAEQAERVTVTVTSEYVGTPDGKATVKHGATPLCVATITAGKGSCLLTASELGAGTADLSAAYAGGAGYARSFSAYRVLAVAKADPAIAVTLSAGKVVYGKEQGERLSVKVTPKGAGTPTGTVTVTSGGKTVCVITLASGKGSCKLAARSLAVGTHALVVVYPGCADFTGSAPVKKKLTVVR